MSQFILQYYSWLSGLNAWLAPVVSNAAALLNVPLLSVLLFGLLGATAPCQLSATVAAIAFVGRKADDPRRMWRHTLAFVAGKTMVYAVVGGVLVLAGFSLAQLSEPVISVAVVARRVMGPLLIVVGLALLGVVRVSFNWSNRLAEWIEARTRPRAGGWPAFALGMAFSFTFCPTLFWLFFGLTLPLAIASPGGVAFPAVFAFGTLLPVLLISSMLTTGLVDVKQGLRRFRLASGWLQRGAAIVLIGVGVNELMLYWFI